MKYLVFKTPINRSREYVFERFDQELLAFLKPKGGSIDFKRYDGNQPGDVVELNVKLFGFVKQHWLVKIKDHVETPSESWFTDVGVVMPWPLHSWKHRHKVVSDGPDKCIIVDHIEFECAPTLMESFMYPVVARMFKQRAPQYKLYFEKS